MIAIISIIGGYYKEIINEKPGFYLIRIKN